MELTDGQGQGDQRPRFSLKRHATSTATGKTHVEQFAFMRDRSHRTHVMCARQCGKTEGDNGILMDSGLFLPHSTNVFLGLNGPQVRMNNFEPKWKRMFRDFAGLDPDWMYERMETRFPNGARVIMSGSDDARHLKNILGGTIDNGVFIVDECFPAGTPVDGRPIEAIQVGDEVSCVDHLTGALARRRVVRVFRQTATDLVRLAVGPRNITCTANHPIFVAGKGYVRAADLQPGDMLCVRRTDDALPHYMLGEVPIGTAERVVDRKPLAHAGGQRQDGGGEASGQPDAFSGRPREGFRDAAADWAQAQDQGRERDRPDAGREGASSRAGTALADRPAGTDEGQAGARVRVSDLLQAGRGGRIDKDLYRGRWSEPWYGSAEGAGREEDGALEWARLDGVSRDEPGSPGGTPVYNLEVEGAHTYFANGVLVHNCQDQVNLDDLLENILPPMMGLNARLILSGVFPEVPAGRFWRESGWQERGGQWVQERRGGWSTHNWGRLANVHIADSWEILQRYLRDTGKSVNDPDIIRDWMGKPAFDPNVTSYRYNAARNGYDIGPPEFMPDWFRIAYATGQDERGRALKYAHPMRPDENGVLHGLMAAMPMMGVKIFALALDPGSASDRASVQGFGWGPDFNGVQHLFDWTSARKAFCSTGDMFAVLGLAYRAFLRWGEVLNPHYDAGSSTNTIDNLQGDYGVPLVLAAKKSDFIGQVNRFNDLMVEGKVKVMRGSALEQDLARARWNKQALERHERKWDSAHHPDASEAGRYALADYFDAATPKGPPAPYGYQEPFAKSPQAQISQNSFSVAEGYAGGNAYPEPERGGGGYGGGWNPGA